MESLSVSSSLFNSNNNSVDELARRAINDHIEHLPDFQLLDAKLITLRGNPAYMLEYKYTDLVFGKAMAMDIGMTNGYKVYLLSYLAEPAKFFRYLPTIQKMIDSFEIQNIVNRFVGRPVAPAVSLRSDNIEAIINLDCLFIMAPILLLMDALYRNTL